MTRTKSWNNRKLESVLHRAADNLSATEAATLVEYPDAVRLTLTVAANALSSEEVDRSHIDKPPIETITGETPHYVSSADAYRQMSKRTQPGKSEDLLTTSELAAQIGLKTRQSVHNWLRKGKIIGWRGAKRGYVFPALQFDNLSRPLKGLERITPYFDDGYAAWVWLTTPHPSFDEVKPLILLRRGEIDQVVAAIQGYMQGDFT